MKRRRLRWPAGDWPRTALYLPAAQRPTTKYAAKCFARGVADAMRGESTSPWVQRSHLLWWTRGYTAAKLRGAMRRDIDRTERDVGLVHVGAAPSGRHVVVEGSR